MSSRRIDVVILCEDKQQEVFARRFLEGWNIETRSIRVVPMPQGWNVKSVIEAFPSELESYRTARVNSEDVRLIAVADADRNSVRDMHQKFDASCSHVGAKIDVRRADERVGIFTPKYRIETWIHFILGNTVDEEVDNYPRFKGHERDPGAKIVAFARECKKTDRSQRLHFPPSLAGACEEFETRIRP